MKSAWLFLLFVWTLSAQDLQSRDVLHVVTEIGRNFFLPFWSISNFKTQTPNNTNLNFGIGYGNKKNWAEVMTQKQWNAKGGYWAVDTRFRFQVTSRLSLYLEPGIFINQPGFYESAFMDYRIWQRLAIGGEMDGIQRPIQTSPKLPRQLNAGPHLSYNLGSRWGLDYGVVVAYRWNKSATGSDEARVYFFATKRFLRRGRR